MIDAVTPSNIPRNAEIVLGYIDGLYVWKPSDWALFPHAEKVRCAVFSATDDGRVGDCEQGDMTPQSAVTWVVNRRKSTVHPLDGPACIYTSYGQWQAVIDAFNAANVAHPDWGVACYDNLPNLTEFIINGVTRPALAPVAFKQFQSTDLIDTSITAPGWPIPLPPPPIPLTADQYAASHGMVRIDAAEAELAVAAHLAWYIWSNGMHGHSDLNIPTGVKLFAFKSGLDANNIPHAGP